MGNGLDKFRRAGTPHLHEPQETAHHREPEVGRSGFESPSALLRIRPDVLYAYLRPKGLAALELPREEVPNKKPGGLLRFVPESAVRNDEVRIVLPPSLPLGNAARYGSSTTRLITAGTACRVSHESPKARALWITRNTSCLPNHLLEINIVWPPRWLKNHLGKCQRPTLPDYVKPAPVAGTRLLLLETPHRSAIALHNRRLYIIRLMECVP